MTQRTRRKKMGILLALLLPITMLLSACKSDNTIEITSNGGVNFTMDMVDTDGLMASSGFTCDMMSDLMVDEQPILDGSFEVKDIGQGDNLGCRFTISAPFAVDGDILTDNGDSFTLNMSSADMGGADMSELGGLGPLDFTFNVTMPGPITDASEGGQINGNTVTFTDPAVLESGFSVTGQKSGGSSGGISGNSGNEGSDTHPESSQSSSNGMPVWGLVLIGVGALILIGAIIFLLTRKKGGSQQGGYPNAPYGQPGQGQQFGQSQAPYGQPGQPGQQFAQGGQPYAQDPQFGQNQAPYGQQPYGQGSSQPQQFGQQAPYGQAPYGQPGQQFGQPQNPYGQQFNQSHQSGEPGQSQQWGQPGSPQAPFAQAPYNQPNQTTPLTPPEPPSSGEAPNEGNWKPQNPESGK